MLRNLIGCTFCLSLLSAAFEVGRADDWPQWLGPRRDSVWRETGIVRKFPEGGPRVKWRVSVHGGYAGPAVAYGRVFVADFQKTGEKKPPEGGEHKRTVREGIERVVCFSATDGKLLWEHKYDCAYGIDYPAGPRVTPTVDGDRVYTLGAEGNLFCLDVKSGAVLWSRDFKKDFNTRTAIWGHAGHPLVDGDKLFCLVGGKGSVAVAFDKETGRERWRALSASEPGYSPPTMIEVGGRKQLVIWHPESVNGLNPETGTVYWSVPLEPQFKMSIATPRQLGEHLFVGGHTNQCVLIKLGQEKPTAEVLWRGARNKGLGPINSTPFLEDGHMYGVDRRGELRCVDLKTGRHLWTSFAVVPGDRPVSCGTGFVVKNGDRFFIANDTGDLIIAGLSPRGYEEISRFHMLEPTSEAFGRSVVWSHPAFANRSVFARNDKELVCVSLAAK